MKWPLVTSPNTRPEVPAAPSSAVQQLAGAIGSAIVTTVFFSILREGGGVRAMTVSVLVVACVVVLCLGLVWLLAASGAGRPVGPVGLASRSSAAAIFLHRTRSTAQTPIDDRATRSIRRF